MKARPILFRGEMIRALLEGRKTQTRRVVKPQPIAKKLAGSGRGACITDTGSGIVVHCPYGQPGDLLWVREGFRSKRVDKLPGDVIYRADHPDASHVPGMYGRPWKPSIHMPRWASRLTLRITDVRVERVQDVSEADAEAEGARAAFSYPGWAGVSSQPLYRWGFHELWESINGPESWDANPWVWVVQFEVIKANVDQIMQEAAG